MYRPPLLYMAYNRADLTEQSWQIVYDLKPEKIFIVCDGPKPDNDEDARKVADVRKVLETVPPNSEVVRIASPINLGCKNRAATGIQEVLEHVDAFVMIEDDILADPSFFPYCEELLHRYKDDQRVGQICGFNPVPLESFDGSYGFAKFGSMWGWATWKRAWRHYDVTMKRWPESSKGETFVSFVDSTIEFNWRRNIFDATHRGELDTWDFQWTFVKIAQSMLSVIPRHNMIQNIGFREDATHTKGSFAPTTPVVSTPFPMVDPVDVMRNKVWERLFLNGEVFGKGYAVTSSELLAGA